MGKADGGASRRAPRRSEPRVETSAGGVVFHRAGDDLRFLLIRDPYENWGLPKGHVEPGETMEQAAIREVREETALPDLELVGRLPTIDWHFRDRGRLIHKFCHFFLMKSATSDARPQLDEGISACLWLPLEDAIQTLSYDNARDVLRTAGEFLRKARLR